MADAESYDDVRGWLAALKRGQYDWRWGGKPMLYFRSSLEYRNRLSFTAIDGMGREKTYQRPFDCNFKLPSGKLEKLCVQATDTICRLNNSTWDRTVVRNCGPKLLRLANIPFRFIPKERRGDRSKYTKADWATVVALWLPTSICLILTPLVPGPSSSAAKEVTAYIDLPYSVSRYPRLARHHRENMPLNRLGLQIDPSWSTATVGAYRTLRPRYLCFIEEKYEISTDGREITRQVPVIRPVPRDDYTPYVMIAYTTKHFRHDIKNHMDMLCALGIKATLEYARSISDEESHRKPVAFWLAHLCTPDDKYMDENGFEQVVDRSALGAEFTREGLANEDTYSISDVVRAAEHVAVLAGNPLKRRSTDPLKEWGERVWTLPEVLLSKGDSITVVYHATGESWIEKVPKQNFPAMAWPDPVYSRQLLEHFTNLRLSRLELMKVSLECLMSRQFKSRYAGDRVYALMGLLRIRPPINKHDSSFQAFARLSLPQDNDKIMERLICLLPENGNENWELMNDQYNSSLWDVYPDTQVCAVGENDTVVVDGCKGAMIQWSHFSPVGTISKLTIKRRIYLSLLQGSSACILVACLAMIASPVAGGVLLALIFAFLLLPAPYFIWTLYSGKLWGVEPCLFGVEGYIPLDVIEEKLFGLGLNRMQWSAFGSPLSRHEPGTVFHERKPLEEEPEDEEAALTHHQADVVDTFDVKAIDPLSPCWKCCHEPGSQCTEHYTLKSVREMSQSPMGQKKIFTLINTASMTATLFEAVRPPVALVIGGTEGGMKRALACSYDVTSGTLYRETVLRIPTQDASRMGSLPRIRLGLKMPFLDTDVERRKGLAPVVATNAAAPTTGESTWVSGTGSIQRAEAFEMAPRGDRVYSEEHQIHSKIFV